MILLTGVTGKVGTHLLAQLSAFRHPTRLLVRDRTRLPEIMTDVEVVSGTFESEALDEALEGVTKALLLLSNSPRQADLECRFIDRAEAMGVRHVVKISAVGADPDSSAVLKRIHGEVEDYLRRSDLIHTIIRPNFFMQNLLTSAATIVSQGAFYLPMGTAQVGMVDGADVAAMALQVLTTSGHENKTYELSGPALMSFEQVAHVMSEVLERTVRYVDIPNDGFRDAMRNAGVDDWYVNAVGDLFALTKAGSSAFVSDDFERVVGRAPSTLAAYVAANRGLFTAENR